MVRKIIINILLVIIIVSFSGCIKYRTVSSGFNQKTEDNLVKETEKINLSELTDEEVLKKNIDNISEERYIQESDNLNIEIKYPRIINTSNEEIEEKINNIIKGRVEEYKNLYYKDEREYKQTIYVNYEISKKSDDIISIVFYVWLYVQGAAHPNNFIYGVTIDLINGKEILFDELFVESVDYKNILNEILNKKVDDLDFELFEKYKGLDDNQGFYIKDESVVVYYQTYVYTPYVLGPLLLEVKLNEIEDLLVTQI